MDIIGNGVDIIKNSRINNSLKNKGFLNRIFTKNEIENYKSLFDMSSKITGESTISYMYYDSFLKNICDNYKNYPKFIFILRNPIDRFISHVNWMRGLGKENNQNSDIIRNSKNEIFREYDDYPNFTTNLDCIISGYLDFLKCLEEIILKL